MSATDLPYTAFVGALVKVQKTLEPAKKDRMNPHYKSKYADLGSVHEAFAKPLAENGFAYSQGGWVSAQGKNYLRTTLYHIGGHSQSFDLPFPDDTSNPQKLGSAITYLRRYGLAAAIGIITDDDDDGNAASDGEKSQTKHYPESALKTAAQAAGLTKSAESAPAGGAGEGYEAAQVVIVSESKPKAWDNGETSYGFKASDGDYFNFNDKTSNWQDFRARMQKSMATKFPVIVTFLRKGKYRYVRNVEPVPVPQEEQEQVPF